MAHKLNCSYCRKPCRLLNGAELYPHRPDLEKLKFHKCDDCDAYVGCHRAGAYTYVGGRKRMSDGTLPYGTVANKELRDKRSMVHKVFDTFWQAGGWTKTQTYAWLAKRMDIFHDQCHVAMFNMEQCEQALEILTKRQAQERQS